jgi:hypothetical protein
MSYVWLQSMPLTVDDCVECEARDDTGKDAAIIDGILDRSPTSKLDLEIEKGAIFSATFSKKL